MASVQDRWFIEEEDATGRIVKVPTRFHGNTTIKRWRAHYRTPDGRQRNKAFARKVDADRFLTTVQSSKLTGTFVDPSRSRLTFGEMATKWTASKVGLKASTRAVYAAVMDDHVLPRWKDIPLSAIEHEDVQAWIAELVAKELSGAHVRKIVGVFSGVLDLAVRGKRLPANPATGVERPRTKSKRKRYLTAGQVEVMAEAAAMLEPGRPKLASNAAFAQYRLVIFVLAYCGLRWSELAALRVGVIDLDKRRLTVAAAVVEVDGIGLVWGTPKSHEARWMSIPRFLVDDLRVHMGERPTNDLLFTAPEGGLMRNRNARRAWFNRAATVAGEAGLTPHELRHTAASLAVSAGANVKAVQRMLGHASAAMTLDLYADLFDDDLEAVADRLDIVREAARVARSLHATPEREFSSGAETATGPQIRLY
jgi:integrase